MRRFTVTLPDGSGFDAYVANLHDDTTRMARLIELAGCEAYSEEDAPSPTGATVYVVRPEDVSDDVAAFVGEEDAEAFAHTFADPDFPMTSPYVERVTVADGELAQRMIAEREAADE